MSESEDVSVAFICSDVGPLDVSKVEVSVSSKFNRKSKLGVDAKIDEIWTERTAANPMLYNASKFRLQSVLKLKPSLPEHPACVIFNLGITYYKDFVGTNLKGPLEGLVLHTEGLLDDGDSQAYFADPLGVGALLITEDKHVVFLHRSEYCAEACNLWDVPGGHPEPWEILQKMPKDEVSCNSLSAVANKIPLEIFNAIKREIRDEVNLPLSTLSEPLLLGVLRSIPACGRPLAEFVVKCSFTKEEVIHLYKKGKQNESFESTDIRLYPLMELPLIKMVDPEFWDNLTPQAKGCIQLYQAIKEI